MSPTGICPATVPPSCAEPQSAAGLAAKRTPAPGQAAGAVNLPGVLATAGRVCVRVIGTLALQRLAELAPGLILGSIRLRRVLGTVRLRRGVSHAGLLPGRRCPQLRTCDAGMPRGRVAVGDELHIGDRELRRRAYPEGPADSVAALILSRVTRMPSRLVRPRANPAIIQYRRMTGVSASSNDSVTSVPAALGSSW